MRAVLFIIISSSAPNWIFDVRTKSLIHNSKRDDDHSCPFHKGVIPTPQPLPPPDRLQKNSRMMDSLPRSRLHLSLRAFKKDGVDYVFPFLTKQGRGKTSGKRYLCFFTCLIMQEVHLEMSCSLATDSFINAFTRMTSSKGMPRYVISDKGSYLGGAESELRQLVEALDPDRLPKNLLSITSLTRS